MITNVTTTLYEFNSKV